MARSGVGVALGASSLALVAYQELFRQPFATGFGDTQFFHHEWELGRVAVARYHELPLWDPFACGGIPDYGDPQSQLHHPLFLLSFLLGTTLALKLFIVAHAAAGFAGMYLYARRAEGLSVAASVLAAGAWAFSGYFAWHCGTGHVGFVSFLLTPWLLWFWRRAQDDLRFAVGVAAVFTLALLAGGAYGFPYFLLLIGVDAAFRLRRAHERKRVLRAAVAVGVLAALCGAWRLVPILEHLGYYPRLRDTRDALGLGELVSLLGRATPHASLAAPAPGHAYGFSEYGAYVGWGVLLLGLVGAVVALARAPRRPALVVGALVFGSLALGDFIRVSPWTLLHLLPVYGSLQVPSRFLFAFLFFLALLAGVTLDEATRRLERVAPQKPVVLGSVVVVLALLAPVVLHHREVLEGRWQSPPVPRGPVAERFHLAAVPTRPREPALLPPPPEMPAQNRGTGYCYTGMGYHPAEGLWAGELPQAVAPEGARISDVSHTTRTTAADVEIPGGGRVVFNQTWAPGWTSNFGPPFADRGRAAVEVPPGRHRVVLRYAPASLPWALCGSLLGIAACIALSRRRVADALASSRASAYAAYGGLGLLATLVYLAGTSAGDPSPHAPVASALSAEATGSGLGDRGAPENAIDGKVATAWLAPEGRTAWLDLRLTPPRAMAGVALLNAPRGTHDLRVEAYSGPIRVGSSPARFTHDGPEPEWLEVPVEAAKVDRLRIVVESWFERGGGIAEARVY